MPPTSSRLHIDAAECAGHILTPFQGCCVSIVGSSAHGQASARELPGPFRRRRNTPPRPLFQFSTAAAIIGALRHRAALARATDGPRAHLLARAVAVRWPLPSVAEWRRSIVAAHPD